MTIIETSFSISTLGMTKQEKADSLFEYIVNVQKEKEQTKCPVLTHYYNSELEGARKVMTNLN